MYVEFGQGESLQIGKYFPFPTRVKAVQGDASYIKTGWLCLPGEQPSGVLARRLCNFSNCDNFRLVREKQLNKGEKEALEVYTLTMILNPQDPNHLHYLETATKYKYHTWSKDEFTYLCPKHFYPWVKTFIFENGRLPTMEELTTLEKKKKGSQKNKDKFPDGTAIGHFCHRQSELQQLMLYNKDNYFDYDVFSQCQAEFQAVAKDKIWQKIANTDEVVVRKVLLTSEPVTYEYYEYEDEPKPKSSNKRPAAEAFGDNPAPGTSAKRSKGEKSKNTDSNILLPGNFTIYNLQFSILVFTIYHLQLAI